MSSPRLSNFHVPALDGIRGLAILLVVPHNASLMLGTAYHGVGYFAKEYSVIGWVGVQLFFVLSGYLITGGLLDSRGSEHYFRSFYMRRALRILPIYYGILLLTFAVMGPLDLLPPETQSTAHNQFWLWVFLSNWMAPLGYEVKGFSHFWSLAVEEQFYLLWPLLVYRLNARQVLKLSIGVCVAALAVRVGMRFVGIAPERLYEFTICRMDALAFGAAAAAYVRQPKAFEKLAQWLPRLPFLAIAILGVGALLTHTYQRTGLETQTFGLSALAAAFMLLVLAAAQLPPGSHVWFTAPLSWKPLRLVGKYSYGMYVYHMPIHLLIGVHLLGVTAKAPTAKTAVLYATAVTVVSYLVAFASYHLFEAHFLRLKRFFPQPVESSRAEPA
jgi:peptidoglycan/LPS O-acetylase OafA/YrhL